MGGLVSSLLAPSAPAGPPTPKELALWIGLKRPKLFSDVYFSNCDVQDFSAFGCANMIPEIANAANNKLVQIGKGLMVTDPSDIKIFDYIRPDTGVESASVSHEGIFAYSFYNRGKKTAVFINLVHYEMAEFTHENIATSFAFFDEKVIMIRNSRKLAIADVKNVFELSSVLVFEDLDSKFVISCTDFASLHFTRTLFYRASDLGIYAYDVDKNTNKQIAERKNMMIVNQTGVYSGMRFIASTTMSPDLIYGMGVGGSFVTIEKKMRTRFKYLVPSSSEPEDIEKVINIFKEPLVFGPYARGPINRSCDLSASIPVRIYRDVFIVFLGSIQKWVVMRMVVE